MGKETVTIELDPAFANPDAVLDQIVDDAVAPIGGAGQRHLSGSTAATGTTTSPPTDMVRGIRS